MVVRLALVALLSIGLVEGRNQKKRAADQEAMRPNPAAASVDSGTLAACPAGSPLGEMSLTVRSNSNDPLPLQTIVHLTEGDIVNYKPIDHGRNRREGEVAMVLVPSKISGGKNGNNEEVVVTDPKSADKPQEWHIPRSVALTVFVYGPQGLSRGRVKNFLSKDDSLVSQLADYADKTSQTEALITALSDAESSSASVNAALNGFASQYGVSVQLDKNAPPSSQAQALFSAMNPQLSTYSPLASNSSARAAQTASLATAAAGLFFGSPVGLLAGGTSMLLDLKSIAFPDTQFRSSYALALKNAHTNLCGERANTPARTRSAYLWAVRIPNAPKPGLELGSANYIPTHQKSPVPVSLSDNDWKYLQRARDWYLEGKSGEHYPISVLKLQNQKSIELDLSKVKVEPGTFHLGASWDWAQFSGKGDVHVLPLSDLSTATVQPQSQDKLLANAGSIPVTVTGPDMEFTSKVEVKKAGDEFAQPAPARFLLPKGLREGPQSKLDVLVETKGLDTGDYQLLLSQADEKAYIVPFKILSNPPKLTNLPILANSGLAEQHFVLKGERLDTITKLEALNAAFEFTPGSADPTALALTVKMQSVPAGNKSPIKMFVKDRAEPILFTDALEVAGPLPIVASSKLAIPPAVGVSLHADEFPAGYALSATLDVKNTDSQSVLRLGCANRSGDATTLHVGEQTATSSLQQLSPDQLYLLLDTARFPAGCTLQVSVDNGRNGVSQPYDLAHILRLPQLDSFAKTDASTYELKGRNLEMIEKIGWDSTTGNNVAGLPAPIPGEGQRQSLSITMPSRPDVSHSAVPEGTSPPPQKPELYLWLRGDKEARNAQPKSIAASDTH